MRCSRASTADTASGSPLRLAGWSPARSHSHASAAVLIATTSRLSASWMSPGPVASAFGAALESISRTARSPCAIYEAISATKPT